MKKIYHRIPLGEVTLVFVKNIISKKCLSLGQFKPHSLGQKAMWISWLNLIEITFQAFSML